ncbi:hypothetical protein TNCT_77381 [Trichonephila clavata]|uniref:Uncharacterized protein n=1 Tax=Trichonephila clavata TaxID=2740835 RepID=A0A8X6FB81_TRICU|nr:hypothetical protein TNCT_77381 [Trichonephila clavata]
MPVANSIPRIGSAYLCKSVFNSYNNFLAESMAENPFAHNRVRHGVSSDPRLGMVNRFYRSHYIQHSMNYKMIDIILTELLAVVVKQL